MELIRRDEQHQILSFANVLMLLWHGPQALDAYNGLYEIAVELAKRDGTGKIAVLSIIHKGTRAPSPRAREALAQLHADRLGVVHRSGVVLPLEGFIASAVRSIALSVRLKAARLSNHEIFRNLDQALTWVTEGLPTSNAMPIPIDALLHALDAHRGAARTEVA